MYSRFLSPQTMYTCMYVCVCIIHQLFMDMALMVEAQVLSYICIYVYMYVCLCVYYSGICLLQHL